jgi:NhaP-type Na+/H+ or K+/H+ antiporter
MTLMVGVTLGILFVAWIMRELKKRHWEHNPIAQICVVLVILAIIALVGFMLLSVGP